MLSPNVRVFQGAEVDHSVILSGVTIGENAAVRRAILDKNVIVPANAKAGTTLPLTGPWQRRP